MKKTYSEKLRHPKWQKKRLEILSRDKFTCTFCKDKETELHVHHEEYHGEPWDCPSNKLKTLCKDCHWMFEYLNAINLEHPIKGIKRPSKGSTYPSFALKYKDLILLIAKNNDGQVLQIGVSNESFVVIQKLLKNG